MAPPSSSTSDVPQSLDAIVTLLTTSNSLAALAHTLRTLPKDTRELLLSGALGSGQDPLDVLDVRVNTLGVLYIMSARLSVPGAPPPSWDAIDGFCAGFDPEQARAAPERVTLLAKGIVRLAADGGAAKQAIPALYALVTRFPPDPSYLTAVHPIFVLLCLTTRHLAPALPLLSPPRIEHLLPGGDLHYTDALTYHYAGGVLLAALERWDEAEEMLDYVVGHPGHPSAVQLEAVKKGRLVGLIARGKVTPLPRYTHPTLLRAFKNSAYSAFVNAYPHNMDALREILDKERATFAADRNLGLLQLALARAPRWALKKLTLTYVTLSLADIGKAVGIPDENEVRALVVAMIESSDISARLSTSPSGETTVTFSDPPPQFTREQVDYVLREVQQQTEMLGEIEQEVGRSKEFLSKAVKTRDDAVWTPNADEEMFANIGAQNMWEETVFS